MLLLSLLTLAVLQEAVVVHSLSSFDPDIPIFRWCNTILRSWEDYWSPMLMLYSLCGTWKLRGAGELHVGDMTHIATAGTVTVDKRRSGGLDQESKRGFSLCWRSNL